MNINWKRFGVISLVVALFISYLGSTISGFHSLLSTEYVGITLGNVITIGLGVFVGEMIVENYLK